MELKFFRYGTMCPATEHGQHAYDCTVAKKPLLEHVSYNITLNLYCLFKKPAHKLIDVTDRAKKDEIVKVVMALKHAKIDEGYTIDVVATRQITWEPTVLGVIFVAFLQFTKHLEVTKRMGEIIAKSCLEKGITKTCIGFASPSRAFSFFTLVSTQFNHKVKRFQVNNM
ncbi:hypothetical protein JHK82_044380 [Glycine max]|nr:hypothetical protein JHK82_044380 [Glycine max]